VTISIYSVTPNFVAEVGDVDLSQPLTPSEIDAIKQAFWKYAVLVFPDQDLSPQQHIDFSGNFGHIEDDRVLAAENTAPRLGAAFADISNLNIEGKIWDKESRERMYKEGNKLWHTDSSFKYKPGLCSLLYATTVAPIGGYTEFADQRAAYDALPDDMKQKLVGMIAEHAIVNSRKRTGFALFSEDEAKRLPPVPQAMLRTIPESGRKTLYMAAHIGRIRGLPDEEARALYEKLMAHITQRQFVVAHRWRPHDLVMWDNRCTMHRGTAYDDMRFVRDMRRTTVSDIANSCEQEGIALRV
jgi:alpha-ketoglutarate-dependent 2,4-dichlorophenoxyacetate dioxygenase